MGNAKPERPKRRALLVASVGVATVSYVVACSHPAAGNLAPPQHINDDTSDASAPVATSPTPPDPTPVAGNLAPPSSTAGPTDDGGIDPSLLQPVAGNLMAYAPDAGPDKTKPKKKPAPTSKPDTSPKPPTGPTTGNLMAPHN